MDRLSSTLDPKSLNKKSNQEVLIALEVQSCKLLRDTFYNVLIGNAIPVILLTSFIINEKGDEPAVKRNEQRMDALRQLSRNIAPLKLRRIQPTKPTKVVSLCDWVDGQVWCCLIKMTSW